MCYFADKDPYSQSYGFSSGRVWMWELDYKESWALKNWCLRTVVLEKTRESPLDCKEIQPVHSEGDQSWIFIGRIDTETETPILWPPDGKKWLIRKVPDAGKDWRQEEKGTTEDEMVGWHHQLDEHEFEQAMGVGDGQGSLACCSPWGHKESDMTERLNWTETMRDHGSVKQSCPRNLSIFSNREAATGLWNCWRDLVVSSEASLSPGHYRNPVTLLNIFPCHQNMPLFSMENPLWLTSSCVVIACQIIPTRNTLFHHHC